MALFSSKKSSNTTNNDNSQTAAQDNAIVAGGDVTQLDGGAIEASFTSGQHYFDGAMKAVSEVMDVVGDYSEKSARTAESAVQSSQALAAVSASNYQPSTLNPAYAIYGAFALVAIVLIGKGNR